MYSEKDMFLTPEHNKVVAYVNGKAIMVSERYPYSLFWTEISEESVTIGEHLVEARLYPVELLSSDERDLIDLALQERGTSIAT